MPRFVAHGQLCVFAMWFRPTLPFFSPWWLPLFLPSFLSDRWPR